MATLRHPTTALLRGLRFSTPRLVPSARAYSDVQPPALLKALKTDLKDAMRARDQPRLSAIRGVLSAVTNLDKADKPIQTDQQMVALMQKQIRGMAEASAEFQAAKRQDLADKYEATMVHLREYIKTSGIEALEGDELVRIVKEVVDTVKAEGDANQGLVMRKLVSPGGALEGKSVDKAEVARLVKESLA